MPDVAGIQGVDRADRRCREGHEAVGLPAVEDHGTALSEGHADDPGIALRRDIHDSRAVIRPGRDRHQRRFGEQDMVGEDHQAAQDVGRGDVGIEDGRHAQTPRLAEQGLGALDPADIDQNRAGPRDRIQGQPRRIIVQARVCVGNNETFAGGIDENGGKRGPRPRDPPDLLRSDTFNGNLAQERIRRRIVSHACP